MLALIYRIVAAGASRMRFFVMLFASVIGLNSIIFVFITMLQCTPVSAYWTLSFTPQKCINEEAHILAAGVINTATDFIIVLLPIRTVKNLALPRKQRVIVYLLFTGGLLASIAGAVRIYFTWQLTSSPDHDLTWNSYLVMLVSSLELFVGIVSLSPAPHPFDLQVGKSRTDMPNPERYAPPSQPPSPSSLDTFLVSSEPQHHRAET
jgi:hypothetical protein